MSYMDDNCHFVTLFISNLEEYNNCYILALKFHFFLRYFQFSQTHSGEKGILTPEHQHTCPLASAQGSRMGSYGSETIGDNYQNISFPFFLAFTGLGLQYKAFHLNRPWIFQYSHWPWNCLDHCKHALH